jgi:membrane fusion protein (multidrug efflux system)
VLVIPQESTFRVLDMTYVYVVGDDNVAHARQITTAQELPHLYVVSDGLQEGEHIMINGLRLVHDGDTIVQTVRDPHEVFIELNNLPAH